MRNFILLAFVGLTLAGCKIGDPNDKPVYGELGPPMNCRALITENIKGWRSGNYTPQAALNSIDRNVESKDTTLASNKPLPRRADSPWC